MPEAILGPIFGAIEGTIGAAIPGVLGGAVVTGLETGLEGAALGAVTAGLEGKPIGKGALFGGLTGGIVGGAGPFVGEALGAGPAVADALTGAGAGALAGKLTGQSAGAGALQGGIGGLLEGLTAPKSGAPSASPTPQGSGGAAGGGAPGGALSTAAPSSVAAGNPDITSRFASDFAPSSEGSLTGVDLATGGASDVVGRGPARFTADFTPATAMAGTVPASGPLGGEGGSSLTGGASEASLAPAGAAAPTVAATIPAGASAVASPLQGLGSKLLSNPKSLLSGGLMVADYFKQQQQNKALGAAGDTTALSKELLAEAQGAQAQGTALESYLSSGNLPPGMQAGVRAATADAEAAIRSEYASRNMSGSSAEAQDIASAHQQAITQSSQIAIQLFQQGVSESQFSNQIYTALMGQALQRDQALSTAVGTFTSALASAKSPVSPYAAAAA